MITIECDVMLQLIFPCVLRFNTAAYIKGPRGGSASLGQEGAARKLYIVTGLFAMEKN